MVDQVYSKSGEELKTDFILHPGEVLLDEIEARELKKSVVAKQLDIPPGHLSEMFKDKRSISALDIWIIPYPTDESDTVLGVIIG